MRKELTFEKHFWKIIKLVEIQSVCKTSMTLCGEQMKMFQVTYEHLTHYWITLKAIILNSQCDNEVNAFE